MRDPDIRFVRASVWKRTGHIGPEETIMGDTNHMGHANNMGGMGGGGMGGFGARPCRPGRSGRTAQGGAHSVG